MRALTETERQHIAGREDARLVLSRHGKTFHWAGRFLPSSELDDAALLYTFCRFVDDTVDAGETPLQAGAAVKALRSSLASNGHARGIVADFIELMERYGLDRRLPLDLVDGVASDIGAVEVATHGDLIRYCYRVAGTVGAMMCPVLKVQDTRALPFAIDLGIAMQLTNIARDVLEDAHRGRIYLPGEKLGISVTCDGLIRGDVEQRAAATRVVLELLALAEDYYRSADLGLRFIPPQARIAILVASRVYRAIGQKIMKSPTRIWRGRTVVPTGEKLVRSGGAILEFLTRPSLLNLGRAKAHRWELHTALTGLLPA